MKLLSLDLKHFRQHSATQLTFQEGLTAIVGSNGAGKTTLIEAISFALYGSRAIRGRIEDLKCRSAGREARPEVSLLFEHDERIYRLDRTLNEASLFQGNEPQAISTGQREVSSRITVILGMDYEEFSSAFYTEQKGLEFLSGKKGGAERERFVVRMLGYDRLERVQELLRNERRDRRNEVVGREATLTSLEKLEMQLAEEKVKLSRIEKEHQDLVATAKSLEKATVSAKELFQEMEKKRSSFTTLQQEFRLKEGMYKDKSGRIRQLEAEKKSRQEESSTEDDDATPAERLALLETAIKESEAERTRLAVEKENMNLAWQEELAHARAATELLKKQINEIEARRKSHKKLKSGASCPTCGQEIGSAFEAVMQHLSEEISKLEAQLKLTGKQLKALGSEPSSLKDLKKQQVASEQKIQKLRAEHQRCQTLVAEAVYGARLDEELLILRRELGESDSALAELRKKIAALQFSEDKYLGLKSSFESSRQLEEAHRLRIAKMGGELATANALVRRTEADIAGLAEKRQELNELRGRLVLLEESDQLLTDFRKYLNSSIRPRLAELAGDFLTDLTDGRYTNVEIGEDFAPIVLDEDGPRAVISGGEEDILNLSMRLALSHMLAERSGQSVSLLVMDEIFGALDENRRSNVLGLLERLGNRFEQILVITHFDDLKEAVQNLIYVDYDEGSATASIASQSGFEEDSAVNL